MRLRRESQEWRHCHWQHYKKWGIDQVMRSTYSRIIIINIVIVLFRELILAYLYYTIFFSFSFFDKNWGHIILCLWLRSWFCHVATCNIYIYISYWMFDGRWQVSIWPSSHYAEMIFGSVFVSVFLILFINSLEI